MLIEIPFRSHVSQMFLNCKLLLLDLSTALDVECGDWYPAEKIH